MARKQSELSVQIDRLLKQGKKPMEIRRAISAHPSHITLRRRALGIAPFPRGAPRGLRNRPLYDQIVKLKSEGMTYRQVAKQVGVSYQRVQQYLRPPNFTTKGKNCACCGTSQGVLTLHHPDYSNPSRVEVLCKKCHAYHHATADSPFVKSGIPYRFPPRTNRKKVLA